MNDTRSNWRIHIGLLLLCTGSILLFGGCEAFKKAEAAKSLEISTPPLERVQDGTYPGSYDAGLTKVDLETVVRDGRITSIKIIRHENGRGEKAEAIVEDIVRAQSLEVDVISGATISSKAILKASERALRKGFDQNGE